MPYHPMYHVFTAKGRQDFFSREEYEDSKIAAITDLYVRGLADFDALDNALNEIFGLKETVTFFPSGPG